MPKSGSYFYPGLNGNIAAGVFNEVAMKARSGEPGAMTDIGYIFVSGSGVNQNAYYKNDLGVTYILGDIISGTFEGAPDFFVGNRLDIRGYLSSSTNTKIDSSSSIDFLNADKDYHINARNGNLIFSSSAGSLVLVSGSFTVVETTTTSDLTVSDVIDVAGYLSSSTNTKIDSSSSIDFLNADKNYHINARNDYLIFSSSAGSIVYVSGNLTASEAILANNITISDVIDVVGYFSSSTSTKIDSSSSFDFLNADKDYHINARNDYLILSSSAGSIVYVSGNLTASEAILANNITISDVIDVVGYFSSSTNTKIDSSSSIDFLNADKDYHINARNDYLILSSSAGSIVYVSGNLTASEAILANNITVSDVFDFAGYLSSSTNTKIDSSSSFDFLNADKDYHINARNSDLIFSSSLNSNTVVSGNLIVPSGDLVVGTSVAAPVSAIVEISSSTQGFLPPRMTDAQKDAIASPENGLVIWNNDSGSLCCFNGTNWKVVTFDET